MKSNLIVILFAVICMSCNAKSENQSDGNWSGLNSKTEVEISSKFVNALDSFAIVMPVIGGDDESSWAADTVHTMAAKLLKEDADFNKKIADTYMMQSYTAYGLAYFNAIIGTYRDPDASRLILHFANDCDSLYNIAKSKDFKDVCSLSELGNHSLLLLQLFKYLNDVNQADDEEDINMGTLGISLISSDILKELHKQKSYSEKDLFKISQLLEGACFFQVYCPLAQIFASTRQEYEENIDIIIEAANYFDSMSQPIYKAFKSNDRIAIPEDSEFEEYMIKATNYKVVLLRIISNEIRNRS